jgi:type II secretory ATPase GspE/PulE/Tfp pilus assembly ATPase PilB-like protein
MDIKIRDRLNVVSLLLGPFVIFGVYAVQVSHKAYSEKMSLQEILREIFHGGIWKRKRRVSFSPATDHMDIRLLDNSGRSIEEVYSGNKKTNVSGIVRLAEVIVWEALEDSASDILIDPDNDNYSVRLRIDGKLQKVRDIPKDVGGAVINSIKALSSMDISEKRRPQDGAFSARIGEGSASFRVASAGVVNGEKLSIRVLNVFSKMLSLEQIGLSEREFQTVSEIIARQSAMIILCGPTGSGKTTSLYAMLGSINNSERNIITVEDPVEYQMPGISQIEINSKAGITFANTLRSILRQDPDVITIGEIRDQETAQIAVQASHTGHLVIGTMHSSDNLTSILRLIDLGIKPVMLADALELVISQRLVRKLCENCKKKTKLSPEKEAILIKRGIDVSGIMQAVGCDKCRGTGYQGRVAIFDVLRMDDDIKTSVSCMENVSPEQLRQIASEKIKSRLHKAAMKKVLKGQTSYSEVKAIC